MGQHTEGAFTQGLGGIGVAHTQAGSSLPSGGASAVLTTVQILVGDQLRQLLLAVLLGCFGRPGVLTLCRLPVAEGLLLLRDVEAWWIASDFAADERALRAKLRDLAASAA